MSIFNDYDKANKQFEKFKFEKSMLTKDSEKNINDNHLKFIPNGESLALEIQNKTTKHIVHFDEKGVSELLKYLNKYLNPNIDKKSEEKIKPQTSEKKLQTTSKQSKKS